MRFTFLFLLALVFTSCAINNSTKTIESSSADVNNKYNRQYKKSIDGRFGKLDSIDLKLFYAALEKNLNTTVDTSKTILINYFQKGNNCIVKSGNDKFEKNVLKNYKNTSDKMSKNYNAKNILVYTKDSYFTKYIANNSCWVEDNGFIKNNIFTSNSNCSGFFILRPDGKFYKYYGEDYFSIVKKLLSAKEWDYPDEIFN